MVIALYGVAFAMVVAGLTAVFRGYEIIVVERGWTLVIAGTVAASSGLILLGIAYAASRINRLAAETSRLRERTGRGDVTYPPPPPNLGAQTASARVPAGAIGFPASDDEPRPSLAPTLAAGGAALGAVAASTVRVGEPRLAEPAPRDDDRDGSPPFDLGRADRDGIAADRDLPGPDDTRDVEAVRDLDSAPGADARDLGDPDHPRREPGLTLAGMSSDRPGALLADDAPPSDDGLFADGDELVAAPAAQDASLDAIEDEDTLARNRGVDTGVDLGAADRDAPDPDGGDAPATEEPVEPPTVVGTYNSGGNNYVMYSDGSIEADTPEGLFKFASLDELKEFIASGGEQHASGS